MHVHSLQLLIMKGRVKGERKGERKGGRKIKVSQGKKRSRIKKLSTVEEKSSADLLCFLFWA